MKIFYLERNKLLTILHSSNLISSSPDSLLAKDLAFLRNKKHCPIPTSTIYLHLNLNLLLLRMNCPYSSLRITPPVMYCIPLPLSDSALYPVSSHQFFLPTEFSSGYKLAIIIPIFKTKDSPPSTPSHIPF